MPAPTCSVPTLPTYLPNIPFHPTRWEARCRKGKVSERSALCRHQVRNLPGASLCSTAWLPDPPSYPTPQRLALFLSFFVFKNIRLLSVAGITSFVWSFIVLSGQRLSSIHSFWMLPCFHVFIPSDHICPQWGAVRQPRVALTPVLSPVTVLAGWDRAPLSCTRTFHFFLWPSNLEACGANL